jgi:polysaccharide export outer membrane protein
MKRSDRVVGPFSGSRRCLLALSILALCAPAAASAEYRLGPGDVLELYVPSAPDLRQKAVVDVDGEIAFPLVGSIKVAGRLLSEVRSELQAALPKKSVRQRGPDGRDSDFFIEADEVTLNIADYRPVYLSGDIARPGELAYRPSMTVRQAIAVAGGLDPLRQKVGNVTIDLPALRGEYESLSAQLVREQTRVARLEAEFAGNAIIDTSRIAGGDAAGDAAAELVRRELELLRTRDADNQNEKNYLNSAVRQTQGRLSTLSEQQKKEEQGVQLDSADLARVQGLYEKGQGTITRVMDSRRALLLSSTRQLQTFAQAGQIELQRDELGRRLQKVDDLRRSEVLDELQTASVKVASLRAQLQGVSEKLLFAGPLISALSSTAKIKVAVFRRGEKGEERIEASEATALLPGDVVQVAIEGIQEATALKGR